MAKILIAEDNVDLACLWAESMRAVGHEVHLVHDGVDAIAAIEREEFDVIIVDFYMPNKGGIVVTGFARLFQEQPNVILVSGNFPTSNKINATQIAERIGARFVLNKPIDMDEFLEKIDSLTKT